MNGRRLVLSVFGAGAVLLGALVAGAYLRDYRAEQASPAGEPAAAGGVTAPRPSAAPPTCDVLSRITPISPQPLTATDLGNGTKRLTSAEAGYSLVVPASWFVAGDLFGSGGLAFGQAHASSYDPRAVPLPRPGSSGMLPADHGIRLDIEVWSNTARESPEQYARRIRIGSDQLSVLPGTSVTVAGQPAYRTTIQDEHRFQPTNAPLIVTSQTRLLWLIPSLRADRMLVVYGTPGDSPLRGSVESAVSALELFQPTQAQLPVIHQRDEILRRWTVDTSGAPIAGRRAEAKLMSHAESYAAIRGGGGLLRVDQDPEELVWLVAVSGPDLPRGRGGLGGNPPPTTWIMFNTPAARDQLIMMGTTYSSAGTWPPTFDALPDRCR